MGGTRSDLQNKARKEMEYKIKFKQLKKHKVHKQQTLQLTEDPMLNHHDETLNKK